MRRRVAGLAGAVCGLCLVVGCTSGAVDPVGQDGVYGPQPRATAPVWPGLTGVTVGDQPSRWWPVASARDLHPSGIDVVASSQAVEGMVVDGAGVVWVDVPWGLVRLDPGTWSATAWDAGDDTAFASTEFVRASSGAGVWLVAQDRVRLFDGIRFVRDIQVPSACLGEVRQGAERVRDLVEVGSELWVATATGVARCDGHCWSMVGEGQLDDVGSLQLTPWGEVWAGSWTAGGTFWWTRYDGTSWTPIDRPGYWPLRAIAPDPTGGIMAAFGPEVLRYDGSDWQTLLQLDDADGAKVRPDAIAASGDGTAWAIVVDERSFSRSLLRSDDEGGGRHITAPDGTSPTAVAVAGDTVVVSADTGVYRVAGDALERVWSPQQRGAAVADIVDVVPVSGDEAWIVTADRSGESDVYALHDLKIGRNDPVLTRGLPASAAQAYWGWPLPSLGSAAVVASDGALWYVTDETVIRIAEGTESVVASRSGEYLPKAYVVNVDVVAREEPGPERADRRPREIGPDGFVELTVPGTTITQTLYGDGDITCPGHWAHDLSLPVGQVQYTPTRQGVEITVTLTRAWPDTEYYVEVNTDQFCTTGRHAYRWEDNHFGGLVTDADGAGRLTLTYAQAPTGASHPPGVALLAGDDGGVWMLATEPGWLEPGDRQPGEQARWEGLRLLARDGGLALVDLPAPARDTLLAVGAGDHLWATVCEGGTEPGTWGIPTCPGGWRLMHREAGWTHVPYPGADVRGLGAAPDGGFWAILAHSIGQFDRGDLAHYREGSWTTFPELTNADGTTDDPEYAVTPAGSVCRIDGEGPTLVCVDPSPRISRTPVGVTGHVAAAADGTLWVWDHQGLARVPITVP